MGTDCRGALGFSVLFFTVFLPVKERVLWGSALHGNLAELGLSPGSTAAAPAGLGADPALPAAVALPPTAIVTRGMGCPVHIGEEKIKEELCFLQCGGLTLFPS